MPWQARTVHVIKAGEMLSELMKEEGDCVVTVLHKICQHRRRREIESADDASITPANLDKIGRLKNNRAVSLF